MEFALGKVCRTNSMYFDEGSALEVLIHPDNIQHIDAGTTTVIVYKAFRGAGFFYALQLPTGER